MGSRPRTGWLWRPRPARDNPGYRPFHEGASRAQGRGTRERSSHDECYSRSPTREPGATMRSTRTLRLISLLGISALAGCGRDPTSAPGFYSLTGHVRMTGYHIDAAGQPAGTRVVGDADGVRVELVHGSQVAAAASTV